MASTVIFDTNAISAWAGSDADLLAVLRYDMPWYLLTIALGEYHYGLLKSERRAELERWVTSIEQACTVMAPDVDTSIHYAELRREIELAGYVVPYHDIWIGAMARQHNIAVLSRDTHFDRMTGVRRVSW